MAGKLNEEVVKQSLQELDGWMLLRGVEIKKTFLFSDFKSAFSFMSSCANYAEHINHHPDWTNSYNKVEVTLTTHDVSGLSQLDFDMAAFMDEASKT